VHGIGLPRIALLSDTVPVAAHVTAQVAAALREDVGSGDVTAALVPEDQRVHGEVITREPAILCGRAWVTETFAQLDHGIQLEWLAGDGDSIAAGSTVLRLSGRARPVLTGERTALNFLQLLSGTASAARRFVDAIAGTGCTILDTRKTVPGLRAAQKYAVRCGGATNLRMGLYDQVLIKENHIAAAGSLSAAVASARRLTPQLKVETEVESFEELDEALACGADIIMLDEFSLADMRTAVSRARAHRSTVKLEASGSVTLENVREIASTGVDYISVGGITKHVRAIDLSMRLRFA
jgi:nicotinate-nucleotide pyrophosphorylase (carboxylating)